MAKDLYLLFGLKEKVATVIATFFKNLLYSSEISSNSSSLGAK